MQLVGMLKQLGATVVFANFSKVITHTHTPPLLHSSPPAPLFSCVSPPRCIDDDDGCNDIDYHQHQQDFAGLCQVVPRLCAEDRPSQGAVHLADARARAMVRSPPLEERERRDRDLIGAGGVGGRTCCSWTSPTTAAWCGWIAPPLALPPSRPSPRRTNWAFVRAHIHPRWIVRRVCDVVGIGGAMVMMLTLGWMWCGV